MIVTFVQLYSPVPARRFPPGATFPASSNVEDVDYRRWSMRNARLLVDHILGCHVPVIAAVNGPAVGLGCSIAVSCDIVLMADTAYMADTHVNVGLVAGDGGVVTWPFMMSMLKAKEYLFTGDRSRPRWPCSLDWPIALSRTRI